MAEPTASSGSRPELRAQTPTLFGAATTTIAAIRPGRNWSTTVCACSDRQMPVDRAEIREVAVNAYDIDGEQFDASSTPRWTGASRAGEAS